MACCREVLVFMKVQEKSPRLLGCSYWKGAEVTVGEKLLIRDFEPLTRQLPQAGCPAIIFQIGYQISVHICLTCFPREGNRR